MKVAALILAAGSSRRMGSPKALLRFAEETFLSRIARVLHEGGAHSVAVVVGGIHRTEIEEAARQLKPALRVIENRAPGEGPITSVRRGIEETPGVDGYLIHPVDLPGVEVADVAAILAAAAAEPGAGAVVPSVDHRRGHPLFLRTNEARKLLEEPPRFATVRDLLRDDAIKLAYVLRENGALLRDFDTPSDLDRDPRAGFG